MISRVSTHWAEEVQGPPAAVVAEGRGAATSNGCNTCD
jgi:hypothetical protein